MKHIYNYDTEMKYYNKSHLIQSFYNFYNDTFHFRKIENISLSQQTYITNHIIKTNANYYLYW